MVSFLRFTRFLELLLLAQLAVAVANDNTDISPLVRHLSRGAEVFYPSAANWSEVTPRWSTNDAPTFFAAIKPGTTGDVQNIVRFASRNQIPFLAVGGGHGFTTTLGEVQNGLEIDLSPFNKISVDARRNRLTVGGGVRFRDIMDPLYAAGKEIQTGSCPCVGMIGASLGAGVGKYQGIHGLIIDALESVKLVTASGNLITVSKYQEPDLFWGIRGAGFNFGIVTEATFRIHDLTNGGSVMNADFLFAGSFNETFFETLASFNGRQPPNLALFAVPAYDPTTGPTIILNAVYVGPQEEGLALLKPFLDIPYLARNITQLPWNEVFDAHMFGGIANTCKGGNPQNNWSQAMAHVDAPTFIAYFNALAELWISHPAAANAIMSIEVFSSRAVLAVPDSETAYPFRDTGVQIIFNFPVNDDTVTAFAEHWVPEFIKTGGFNESRVYVSYAHGDEPLENKYGARKLPRLLRLKKKWDPKGIFSFNNGLPVV
ncbi:FAD-dependent oxidase [Aspergillus ustus]|uniref:FAD-dependent oxidase n=1 Tax=Aspergillus ustus TaxID=40382 RepID=A0A0C1C3I3_ASPUT|nr:FAD-dependent oxidase [Aspergillus ustus]